MPGMPSPGFSSPSHKAGFSIGAGKGSFRCHHLLLCISKGVGGSASPPALSRAKSLEDLREINLESHDLFDTAVLPKSNFS